MDSQHKLIPQFITLIALSGLLVILDMFGLLGLPKRFILTVSTPVEHGIYSLYQNTINTFSFLTFWKSGYKEITYLKQRNAELNVTADKVKKLQSENEILKNQFAASGPEAINFLPAKVVGFSRFLFLDKGAKDGVKKGQAVILNDIFVGRIQEVEDGIAKVILPTDPDSKIQVITSTNHARGIIHGAFGKELVLGEVIQSEKIDLEEPVQTFFTDWGSPGFLVGKIKKLTKSDSSIFQTAIVLPILDYDKLQVVFIKIK